MKKLLCLCMVGISMLTGLGGCAAPPATTKPTTTEPVPTAATQPPEEADVFKVLLIGQSLGQDTVWLLETILRTEMPDKKFVVGDIYESVSLGQHRKNILNNAAIYKYYKFTDGTYTKMEGVSIDMALRDEWWDLIIFNDSTYATTQASEFEDGDHAFMIQHIRDNAIPGYKLAYNATGANPTSAILWTGPDRRAAEVGVHQRFEREFGGSRNLYYDRICSNIKTYIETNKEFDLVFHSGTALQYASETYGVPEADVERVYDLYRDYVHLSDFGRLIAAYQLYAQIFGLEKLEDVKVNMIRQGMRATERERKFGDLQITQKHKDALIASVNFALAHPNEVPEQKARPAAILEPLS